MRRLIGNALFYLFGAFIVVVFAPFVLLESLLGLSDPADTYDWQNW